MAERTVTLDEITNHVHRQYERAAMVGELSRLAIESLPNTTDADTQRALLTGIQEISATDSANLHRLYERLTQRSGTELER